MNYSIIVPVYNEFKNITPLLEQLSNYSKDNEIIFIDDGSTDGSLTILEASKTIKLIKNNLRRGKGAAIRKALEQARYDKIIITDGDLELDTNDIKKLMILNKELKTECVFGVRKINKTKFSLFNYGNTLITNLFNLLFSKSFSDVLCCSKSFYKSSIDLNELRSTDFDIDVELIHNLLKKNSFIKELEINYNRRSKKDGKKLKIKDGLIICKRIFMMRYF